MSKGTDDTLIDQAAYRTYLCYLQLTVSVKRKNYTDIENNVVCHHVKYNKFLQAGGKL